MTLLVRAVVGDQRSGGRGLLADRRQFLQLGAATGAVAAVTGFGGWAALVKRYDVSRVRSRISLPTPSASGSWTQLGT